MLKAPQRFKEHWKENSLEAAIILIALNELADHAALRTVLWDTFFLKPEEIQEIEDALHNNFFGELNGHKSPNTREKALRSYMLLWQNYGNIWGIAVVTVKLAVALKISASELVIVASTNDQLKHLTAANWEYFLKGVTT